MGGNAVYSRLEALSEDELRRDVIIPILSKTPGVYQVTDVHGTGEKGLDVVFCTVDPIRKTWYGLQLKKGKIAGGGRGKQTVKEIVDQLGLANDHEHYVASPPAGKYRMDRFIVASSGRVSQAARQEIAGRVTPMDVEFWDLPEIVARARDVFPEVLQVADAEIVEYLKALKAQSEVLDALDQVPGVAERSLSEVFVEPGLRRRIDPSVAGDSAARASAPLPALQVASEERSAVLIGEQNEGKTAILRMIAIRRSDELLDGKEGEDDKPLRVPVFVRASSVVGAGSLPEAVANALEAGGAQRRADELRKDGGLGEYLVLLDGFSELPSEEAKARCADLVLEAEDNRNCRLVIAGRPDDFLRPHYFSASHHYTIPPFNAPEIRRLVRHWTKDAVKVQDVAERLVERVRDALQLPGSPIPAIIGVMLYEKEQRFVTNTADAVDRYMQIRLGRYAREMGVRMEVDWARKQDLLGEMAFEMVKEGVDAVPRGGAVDVMRRIYARLGEENKAEVALQELIDAGVLFESEGQLRFYRTAFRDFFAAHHLRGRAQEFDDFFLTHLFDRRWGQVLVFAAGLRRHNSDLLMKLNDRVEKEREQHTVFNGEDYLYGAYLLGRILSNSDYSDNNPRLQVLRTTVAAARESADLLAEEAVQQFGNIGNVIALVGTEHTLFVAVGVPWLRNQIRELCDDQELSEDERYLLCSLHTHLACPDWIGVFDALLAEATSARVIAALVISGHIIDAVRPMEGAEAARWAEIKRSLAKKRQRFQATVDKALEVKDRLIEMEQRRIQRLSKEKH